MFEPTSGGGWLVTGHGEATAEILEAIRVGVGKADGPQEMLDAVVARIRPYLEIHRVSIRKIADVMLEIVAVYNEGPTNLGLGVRMSTKASSLPAILTTGRPVFQSLTATKDAFAEQLVMSEGVTSYVTMPLRDRGVIAGLLSFSSRSPTAFVPEDVPFLEEVAAILEARVGSFLSS